MSVRKANLMATLALVSVATGALVVAPASRAQSAAAGEVRHVLPRLQVVRDSVSGKMRAPTHEEAAAQQQQQQTLRGGARGAAKASASMPADHPMLRVAQAPPPQARMGATGRRFDLDKMPYSVAHRGADGHVDTACVVGDDAAAKAMAGQSATATAGGHRHAH